MLCVFLIQETVCVWTWTIKKKKCEQKTPTQTLQKQNLSATYYKRLIAGLPTTSY